MSVTIDSSIIKALVEHIGGNPDSVPDGTSFLNATWSVDDNGDLTFTLPEGQELPIGSIIRLKATTGETADYIYVGTETRENQGVFYNLRLVSNLSDYANMTIENGVYGTRFNTTVLVIPDNVTSGILNRPSYDDLVKMLMAVIDKAITKE